MLAFDASQVEHGTRVPDEEGQVCERIGLAIAMQMTPMKKAIAEHKDTKHRQAQEQALKIAEVMQRHIEGVNRHGGPLRFKLEEKAESKLILSDLLPCVSASVLYTCTCCIT